MKHLQRKSYYNKMPYAWFMIICVLAILVIASVYLLIDYNNKFRFSVDSGFYDDPFELKILGSKKYDVFYTLDGSAPTTDSIRYDSGIQISDRTPEANEYSNRYEISTGYYSEEIEAYSYSVEDPMYVLPDYKVDKCTVVRAGIFDKKGKLIDEISGVYFIGAEKKETYDDIMVVSIATDPYDLFDFYDGIYVTGCDFTDYMELCETVGYDTFWWASYWYMWPANYRRTGMASERVARVDIIENGTLLSQTCGIRMQGAGSRGKLPRNIRLISREEYSGSRYFQNDILDNGLDAHKYILFGGADDNIYKIKDYLAQTMESELDFATMDFKPCVCFIEGEYWGAYYLTEDYNNDYIQSHYNVPRDDVIIWKEGEIEEGNEEDLELYTDMASFISENDMTDDENYKKACSMIDINSFVDYYAAQIFIARGGDWPGGNIAAWRSRGVNLNSQYQDGKWRWMLFDLNSEAADLDLELLEEDTLEETLKNSEMFASLIENESFKELFCERLQYIEKNVYSEDKVNDFFDKYYEQMLEPLCESNMRFYGEEKQDEIVSNAESIRTFLLERHTYVDKMIVEHFGAEYLEGVADK